MKRVEDDIFRMLREANEGRVRPHAIIKAVSQRTGISFAVAKSVLMDLVRREVLVYTYRDPCSFVEFPSS